MSNSPMFTQNTYIYTVYGDEILYQHNFDPERPKVKVTNDNFFEKSRFPGQNSSSLALTVGKKL